MSSDRVNTMSPEAIENRYELIHSHSFRKLLTQRFNKKYEPEKQEFQHAVLPLLQSGMKD